MAKKTIYQTLGCSQEDHLPNCGHFGFNGDYLSNHLMTCPQYDGHEACNCNPTARKRAAKEAQ